LKAKKQDKNLRELFRHNLENAEVIPDPSVSATLMRRLAVREFLHFNPFRFNIYYLGGLITAGIITVLVLTSGPGQKENGQSEEILNTTPVKDKSENVEIQGRQAPADKNSDDIVKPADTVVKKSVTGKDRGSEKVIIAKEDPLTKSDFTPVRINESFKGKDLYSRSTDDNFKLQDPGMPEEQVIEPSVNEGCAPLRVIFKNKLTGNDSCLWTFGDGGSSSARNPEWIYDVEGEYRVVLKVFEQDGLKSSSSVVIKVNPKPSARFEIYPDKAFIPEDEIRFQNYSAAAIRYLWNFGDGNTSEQFEPDHRYEKYGNYNVSLKVYSEKGCSDSLMVLNAFSGSAYFIEFPNAFIPNTGGPSGGVYSSVSDETAQVFHPSFSGVSEYHLKIFSKMGVLIFETNDINIGWDGYFKGQLNNPGVYIWKVRGNFSNGEPFTKMGDVTLLRN
jgi:PKD repeat protein